VCSPTGRRPNEREAATLQTGYGRVMALDAFTSFAEVLQRVKVGLGIPTVRVALPAKYDNQTEGIEIKTVAVCGGSGSGVFKSLGATKVDLLLTGEMSHHEVLAATAGGAIVMLTEHTNTERGFLSAKLQRILSDSLGAGVEVLVASTDADPLVFFEEYEEDLVTPAVVRPCDGCNRDRGNLRLPFPCRTLLLQF
jgi:putative NIF3 family GTP cyclohydrolase 1 type 2